MECNPTFVRQSTAAHLVAGFIQQRAGKIFSHHPLLGWSIEGSECLVAACFCPQLPVPGIPARGLADRIRWGWREDLKKLPVIGGGLGLGFIPPVDGVEEEYHPV